LTPLHFEETVSKVRSLFQDKHSNIWSKVRRQVFNLTTYQISEEKHSLLP